MTSGFYDYIAARVLFSNRCYFQGAMIAAVAVEKYIKAGIKAYNLDDDIPRIHMDRIDSLERVLINTPHYKQYSKVDKAFLKELSIAYKLRYFDNFKSAISMGFIANQFLCELDHLVAFYNYHIRLSDEDGTIRHTAYSINVQRKNPHLLNNNFVLEGTDKTDFMNKASHCYMFYYHPLTDTLEFKTEEELVPGSILPFQGVDYFIPKYVDSIASLRVKWSEVED